MQKSRGSVAKRRRNARQKAMQALYQWDFDTEAQSITHIVDQFCDMQNMDKVDVEYFRELFYYAAKNLSTIDELIEPYLDRPMERLDPVEKSVLRIACAELTSRLDTPYKVVVNEAVEVCKLFGAEEGHKFVNGIVDKLAANIRQIEYNKENARRGQDKKEPDTKGQDTKGQDTKSQDTNGPETSANVSDAASGTDSD
jgi:N utilization substance protein B